MARGKKKVELKHATRKVGLRAVLLSGKSKRFYKRKSKELLDYVENMHRMLRAARELVKLFLCDVMDVDKPVEHFVNRYSIISLVSIIIFVILIYPNFFSVVIVSAGTTNCQ